MRLFLKDMIYDMNTAIDSDLKIPTEMIPRCPQCGAELEPWVRGYTFLEGAKYKDEYRKIREFLQQHGSFSRLAYLKRYKEQPSQMMRNLYALVENKDYFVVTTNGEDHFSLAGFDLGRVFEMEGKITEYRCASRCHEMAYNNPEGMIRMAWLCCFLSD